MNRHLLLLLCSSLSLGLFAQSADSLLVTKQVDSLLLGAQKRFWADQYEEALTLITKAEKRALEQLGRENATYARVCSFQADVLFFSGVFHYQESEKWYLEAKAIQERILPQDHPAYVRTIHGLARLYLWWDQYAKAEEYFNQELAIRKRSTGTEQPEYASTLTLMAQMYYYNLGNYSKAETMYLEAKSILERTVGKMDLDYGEAVEGLADLNDVIGEYDKSETYYEEYLAILENDSGKNSLDYAHCLNNMAELYKNMGNYPKAKSMVLESKAIREKLTGKQSYEYASSLTNVAEIEYILGNFKAAEKLLIEAGPIFEKIDGRDGANYAWYEWDLANVYKKLGQYEQAEGLFLDVIRIYKNVFGERHRDYLAVLPNLAGLYYKQGKRAAAESLYLEFLGTWEETLGKENADYLSALKNLSELYWKAGKWADARRYMVEANEIEKKLLLKASKHLSEQELEMFIREYSSGQNRVLSFARLQKGGADICYDDIVFYKGFMLNSMVQLGVMASRDSSTAALFRQLKSIESRLSREYSMPIDKRAEVPELESKVNVLEKELARKIAGFGDDLRQVNWKEVQAGLKPEEAAIEFVRYRFKNPKNTDSILYAALLLLPAAKEPRFISLFEEKELQSLLQSKGMLRADYVNDLYSFASRGINPLNDQRKSLAELIWKPIEKELNVAIQAMELGAVARIYYAPSGLLHRLNLGAIAIAPQEEEGGTLADKFRLVQLKSTRQLAVPESHLITNNEAILFGGVEFNPDSSLVQDNSLAVVEPKALGTRGQTPKDSSFWLAARGLEGIGSSWNALPGTEREVNALEKILLQTGAPTTLLKGKNASEESFKSIGSGKPSPRILHLATHGYFFPDDKDSQAEKDEEDQSSVFETSENPMLRSGLLLAGANAAWASGQPPKPGMEDGILTAYEISQMDLSNTELVVLSACETGLGDIQGNEGVYGLQRAFKIAGVKYLIMSLWQVPDKQTGELMKAFYQQWLVEKKTVPEAFHAAQQAMRERFVDPYVWAGFVLVE